VGGRWKGLLSASASLSEQWESGWKGLLGGEVMQTPEQVCVTTELQIKCFWYLDPDSLASLRNNVQCPVQSTDWHGALHGEHRHPREDKLSSLDRKIKKI